jgi:hypothetical protein
MVEPAPKELPMSPSPAEVAAARRVLNAIRQGGHPSQADALVLRLWAGPYTKMHPLLDIARKILKYVIDDQS